MNVEVYDDDGYNGYGIDGGCITDGCCMDEDNLEHCFHILQEKSKALYLPVFHSFI